MEYLSATLHTALELRRPVSLHMLVHEHAGRERLPADVARNLRAVSLRDVLLKSVLDRVASFAVRAGKVALDVHRRSVLIELHLRREDFSALARMLLDDGGMEDLLVVLQSRFRKQRRWAVRAVVLLPRLRIHVRLDVVFEIVLDAVAFAAEVAGESYFLGVRAEDLKID